MDILSMVVEAVVVLVIEGVVFAWWVLKDFHLVQ